MAKRRLRRGLGRVLHLLARFAPGAWTVRPFLHRLRGVRIGKGVFIGEEVYLDNEYPERIEIQDRVQISVRATILAHTRGPGAIVLEEDCYIGPHVVVVTSGGKTLRIGAGAVVAAGCVVTKDVPPRAFVSADLGKPVAEARIPLASADTLEDFIRGLAPLRSGRPKR